MVQRWDVAAGLFTQHPTGGYVTYADHARIVAEAGAAVFAFHPEWTVTGMCDSDCLACRRLTELITERSAGYEEGKADAEQAHAAALAAAVAAARAEVVTVELVGDYATGYNAGLIEGDAKGRREGKRLAEAAAAPRTLTADDPEPAVGSVVLGRYEISGQRVMDDDEETTIWRFSDGGWCYEWATVQRMYGPVTLIHDGGAA